MRLPIKGDRLVRERQRRHAHPAGLRRAGPALVGAHRDVPADRGHEPALARRARSRSREHPRVAQGHGRRRHPRRHRRVPDRAGGPQGSGPERRMPGAERPRRRRHSGPVRQVPGPARGQGRHPGRGRLPRGRRRPGRHPRHQGRLPEGARPARPRSEEERLPEVHQLEGGERARAPAGALRDRVRDHRAGQLPDARRDRGPPQGEPVDQEDADRGTHRQPRQRRPQPRSVEATRGERPHVARAARHRYQGRLESEGLRARPEPIESNDTDAGRLANRRVEFKILEEESGGGGSKE